MTDITESRPFQEAAVPSAIEGQGRLRIALMTPGWGSSGYYSADVCEAAGTDRVFPAGTHMYINHPTATENYERPVRDLNQLAAVLAEDAVWNSDQQRLEAEITTFSNWRTPIAEMAPHIGVSIRATADVEEGSAEGRTGPIITRIDQGLSVDFVTRAGRGGEVLEVLEHAFTEGVVASRTVHEAMSSDIREALYDLVRETYRSDNQYAWVRDYDATSSVVYFDIEGDDTNGTFQQSFESDASGVPTGLSGESTEVRVTTTYVPVAAPSGQSTSTEESLEDTMPQIEEARLRALEEAEARNATLQTELAAATARAEEAETSRDELRTTANVATARGIIESAFRDADIAAPRTAERLAANPPLLESGLVDEEAMRTLATESAAELAEARGDGKVRGLGFGSTKDSEDISEADLDRELAKFSPNYVKEG
jgi:hypothetical protein